MADDKQSPRNGEDQGPFRENLTYDELTALMNKELTLDEILAARKQNQTGNQMTSKSVVAEQLEPHQVSPASVAPVTDPGLKENQPNSRQEQAQPVNNQPREHTLEIHEVADPFLAGKADQAEAQTSQKQVSNFSAKLTPSFDKEGQMAEPKMTAPQPPTYVAGSDFLDQTAGLGATSVINLSQLHKETSGETVDPVTGDEVVAQPDELTNNADSTKMLRGSMWMTLGSLASRLLGALYIIPWVAMIGNVYYNQANSLYAQGYQIYSVALMIATAGLPNVLARLVAEYSAKHEFNRVQQVFYQSLKLGGVMGLLAAAVLYLFAGPLSQGDPNVVLVIRSLSAAVLVIPVLGMLRGYLQGYEFMGTSALSQFIEQIVRVAYMLGMTYWIMVAGHGTWVDATVQSTFAAFWGALAGIAVLVVALIKKRTFFKKEQATARAVPLINTNNLLLKMARQSVPVILAGSAISLLQVMDQYTFFNIMRTFTHFTANAVTDMYSQFAFNSNKLTMLVVSLAVGMAETALPMLARARSLGNRQIISDQITYALKLLSAVMIPAALGMAAIAKPLYLLFYNTNDLHNGVLVLQFASFTSVALGAYMVVLALYQGLGQLAYTLRVLVIILGAKLILQVPLTIIFVGMGPLLATTIAFAIGLYLAIKHLTSQYDINWLPFNYALMTILLWSLVMYAVVTPITGTLSIFMPQTKWAQLLIILIAGGIGVVIYGLAILKTQVGTDIFGDRFKKLVDKLPF
ncbi:putative polysaccharide biosynthesis protein [Weissella halotolerans]|uniref:Polysaccharide biosynthesis protein n=1 Tax=Weissella halotolerans DSM 20190 TaxID=1123500 RepID=A0A0R2G2R5_9LACO|nr:polysaccharide biosynthesis protein [Weissella halotolerans]KRN31204.1 polysaccharide biosynthesis protein [Weissella halotolerans DSM 20190]